MTRVLVVDEDLAAAGDIVEALRAAGYSGRLCQDPRLAIEDVQRYLPDLVIVDVGRDLLDAVQRVGAVKALMPQVRFIALAAHHRFFTAGVADLFFASLPKPTDLAELLAAAEAATRPYRPPEPPPRRPAAPDRPPAGC